MDGTKIMKHYIDENKQLHGIGEATDIDGDQSFLVQDTWTLLTDEEFQAIVNAPVPIPDATNITNKQGRLQLLALGKYSDVQTAINSLPSPQKEQAQIEYDFAPTWEINHPTLLMLLVALGISDSDVQALFNEASKL